MVETQIYLLAAAERDCHPLGHAHEFSMARSMRAARNSMARHSMVPQPPQAARARDQEPLLLQDYNTPRHNTHGDSSRRDSSHDDSSAHPSPDLASLSLFSLQPYLTGPG